jgi:hypothetical protein
LHQLHWRLSSHPPSSGLPKYPACRFDSVVIA